MKFINVEVGYTSKQEVSRMCTWLKEVLDEVYPDNKCIICPNRNGVGRISITSDSNESNDWLVLDLNKVDIDKMTDDELGTYIKSMLSYDEVCNN